MNHLSLPSARATRRGVLTGVLGAGIAGALSACGGGSNSPLETSTTSTTDSASAAASGSSGSSGSAASGSITIGSANFPESALLAQIYSQALSAKGVTTSTTLNIGNRETYLGALTDGSIQLVPEYTGVLARYYDKSADISTPDAALASLKKALPADFQVLEPSAAQDSDSMCVTKATADKYGLTSIADLSGKSSSLVLGGPPEFKTRVDGVQGLQRVYGLTFKKFQPLDAAGALTVTALKNGQVDVANLFTTDPQVKANNFVVLDDPKHLFGAQNVVPLVRKDAVTTQVTDTLNAVSAKLTTDTLATLVTKVVIDKADAATVATQFLKDAGLA